MTHYNVVMESFMETVFDPFETVLAEEVSAASSEQNRKLREALSGTKRRPQRSPVAP